LRLVKTTRDFVDRLERFKLIAQDHDRNPDRALLAFGIVDEDANTEALIRIVDWFLLYPHILVVVASGNHRRRSDEIDYLPMSLYGGHSYPLSIEGGTNENGDRLLL
jgi:hypothetical protein